MNKLIIDIEFIVKSLGLESICDKPISLKYNEVKITAEITLTPKTKIANL